MVILWFQIFWHFPGRSDKNYKNFDQDSRLSVWYLKQISAEYEAGLLSSPPPTVAPCILPHWSNKRFSQAGLIFNLLSTVLHPELHSFICIVSYFYLVQICMASWISFLTCICLRRRVKNKKSRNIVTSLHPVLICVWCHLTLVRATSARVWYVSSARTVV